MLSYAASNVGLVNAYGVKFLVSLTALSLFFSPFWLIFAERCRTITENVNISSVWAFSQVALDREFKKIRKISESTRKICEPIISSAYKTVRENIEKLQKKREEKK